jgi:SAM-dependent methyltransferase
MVGLDQMLYSERDWLNSISNLFDETTLAWCERSGLRPGAHVLELGAGAGSIAAAMAQRVGREGRVIAVDRDIRYLNNLPCQVEIMEVDILHEPLPAGPFDLVHARLLLGHLGEPITRLWTWIDVLKPGGWLVVEEADSSGCCESVPFSSGFCAVHLAIVDEVARGGFDPRLGLRLPSIAHKCGLDYVEAVTIRPRVHGDSHKGVPVLDLLAAKLAPTLTAHGHITDQEYAEFRRVTHDPDAWCGLASLTTVRGRRRERPPASLAPQVGHFIHI